MEKKLLVLFVIAFSLLTSCTKKADDTTPESSTTIAGCLQQSATNYDAQGAITSQNLYHYSNNRLDSMVTTSANSKSVTIYTYLPNNERRQNFYNNGVKSDISALQKLDNKGNVIESVSYNNQQKGGGIRYSYNCN